jgi:diaminopimelate epimerase
MHGTGNDYVYINTFEQKIEDPAKLAIEVSHRHFGIGSDGLILINPTPDADAEMEMYNADGSRSEMCGNGLRCVAKFVYDHNIARKEHLRLLTGDGVKEAIIHPGADGLAEFITLDMGLPRLEAQAIPSTFTGEQVIEYPVTVANRQFQITLVNMGNPHCVIFVDDVQNFPVEKYGPLLENAQWFPKRINVEFVQVVSPEHVIQRTWERGSGETWACGTGASAVCVAGVLTGRTQSNLKITLLGGDLELAYTKGSQVKMKGPAVEVFSGIF